MAGAPITGRRLLVPLLEFSGHPAKHLQGDDTQDGVNPQHVPHVLRVPQAFEIAIQGGVSHAAEGRADHDREEIHAHVHAGFFFRRDPGDVLLDAGRRGHLADREDHDAQENNGGRRNICETDDRKPDRDQQQTGHRGRTVRSLAWLLSLFDGVKLYFVAPEQLQIGQDILDLLDAAGTDYELTQDFESVMPAADAIYMTRIQDEWDTGGRASTTEASDYRIGAEHLDILKPHCAILHPLPRRREISTEIDNDPRAMYWRQMRNGMWIRAALILTTFGREAEVHRYYDAYKPPV